MAYDPLFVRDGRAEKGYGITEAPIPCMEGAESGSLSMRDSSSIVSERNGGKVLDTSTYVQSDPHEQERPPLDAPDESGITGRSERDVPVCVGMSEIDKFASDVLRYHYPETTNYGDITKIRWGEVEDFDLLVGGVPCQSWSIAGKRGGFGDIRGTMWFEFAKCLREKQPKMFIAENVKGLLSHDKGNSVKKILAELCSCGYAVDFDVLNAKFYGVPQNRERVFIIGKRIDLLREEEIV